MSERTVAARLVTSDVQLVDAVLEAAESADVTVAVAPSLQAIKGLAAAPLLLVGQDIADADPAVEVGVPDVVVCCTGAGSEPPQAAWRAAQSWHADHVVVLPEGRQWLAGLLSTVRHEANADPLLMAVVPGQGGAGASVLAAATAQLAAKRGTHCLLVDGGAHSGLLDVLTGCDERPGIRWPEVTAQVGSPSLASLLPSVDGLSVLAHDRSEPWAPDQADVRRVLALAARDYELVVVDCSSREQELEAWLEVVDRAVLVSRTEVRAGIQAARVARRLDAAGLPADLVVRTTGRIGLAPRDVGSVIGRPVVARVRSDRRVAEAVERSRLREVLDSGSLATAASGLLVGMDADWEVRRAG